MKSILSLFLVYKVTESANLGIFQVPGQAEQGIIGLSELDRVGQESGQARNVHRGNSNSFLV